MSASERAVAAVQGAVGARFRLHGRDPAYGLDCIGVGALALRAVGYEGEIPGGYVLRHTETIGFVALIDAGAMTHVDDPMPGDLMLCASGPAQFHVAVKVPGGFVHADAMLRRVVERPGMPPWPLVAAWRLEGD